MVFTFKVDSFRRIPCPFGRDKIAEKAQVTYIAVANVKELPNNLWRDTNPREIREGTKVWKAIEEGLTNNPDQTFHLLNRGLLLSAEKVHFNNDRGELSIVMTDKEKHGCVDGGHTYELIKRHKKDLPDDQFVRLEIMTGIEDFFEQLAGARNTSVQVQDKALAELEGHFDILKDALKDTPFAEDIAYKENAAGRIDIREIVAILAMFDRERFGDDSSPVVAYSSKAKCLEFYLEGIKREVDNPYYKLTKIAPDIFDLYGHIESRVAVLYNQGKDGDGNRHYGAIKGIVYKDGKAFHPVLFKGGTLIAYESPKGFLYPIVGAFRFLVEEDPKTGFYRWRPGAHPKDLFEEIGSEMISRTVERSRSSGNNPQSVGKDSGHWAAMLDKVTASYLKKVYGKGMAV